MTDNKTVSRPRAAEDGEKERRMCLACTGTGWDWMAPCLYCGGLGYIKPERKP